MQNTINYIGVDISKLFFDVALPCGGGYRHYKFSNDQTGFSALLKILPQESLVVMEASGAYYLRLANFLFRKKIGVSVINPLIIRRFGQMRMSRAKTDKKDARMIAQYGSLERPGLWQPPKKHEIALGQMEAILANARKEHTAVNNQLESFIHGGMLDKNIEKVLREELAHKQKLIDELTLSIEELARKHYSSLLDSLESIPGLGRKTAIMLMVVSGGFSRFSDYRKLSSYIGLSPRIFESGTSIRGKARICKMGMSRLRGMLYLCAWSAKRYNKACSELYERLLSKGKAKKLALVAVANKLLKQSFAIVTSQTIYNENYLSKPCF